MSWTRRSVVLSLVGLAAAAGGGFVLFRPRRPAPGPDGFIVDLLRRRLAHLDLDPPSLRRFVAEHLARASPAELAELEAAAGGPSPGLWTRVAGEAAEMTFQQRQLERRLVARLLLGSDAFRGERRGGVTRFVAYPDPYEVGCANPLASRQPSPSGETS